MATAVIGVFSVFMDFGLSVAAIQRSEITAGQSSTLFWISLLAGAILTLLTLAMGPFVAACYHEQRLVGVTTGLRRHSSLMLLVYSTALCWSVRCGSSLLSVMDVLSFAGKRNDWYRHGP
jgi:O-antigen/teichoic acid export membrane protein